MKKTAVPSLALSLALALFAFAPSIHAANQVVTDFGDNGGANQLRAKLAALQSSGGGALTFGPGTATIVLANGVLPAITKNTTIDGASRITISGGNASSILSVGSGATLTLKNITITRGFNNGDGGAIYNGGTLNVNNSKFLSNLASATGGSGGAIVSYGPLNITNSEFAFNKAANGGAIYPRFAAAVTKISGSNLHDNEATNTMNGWGGAILLWDGAPVTIQTSTVNGNKARLGGAFYVFANSQLTLKTSNVNYNQAIAAGGSGGSGGGIENTGTTTITDCTLAGNSASYTGGAIDNNHVYGLSLTNVTISNNSAEFGGGISNTKGKGTLTNVTIVGNSASFNGGGIDNGTYSGEGLTLINTIVANSPSGGNCYDMNAKTINSSGFNLSSDGTCNEFFDQPGDQNGVDPMLGDLAANGGPTSTRLPLAGSPAIDNGTTAGAPARDQRGFARAGAAPDIGAAEAEGTLPVVLGNISTRLRVLTGDNVLIGGFIISGTHAKKIMLRAIGPSIPLAGVLANPTLELHNGAGASIASNDNWQSAANHQAITDTGIAPTNALESAILTSLSPGAYTAIVRGVNNGTGIALVEAYDLDRTVDSKLGNISTRGLVQTGDNALIGGFIVVGPDSQKVIIRAIGPSLPLSGKLANPVLELHDGNGVLLATNDNWKSTQQTEIAATGIPPSNDLESAIVRTLTPGAYTAIVRGVNNTTGIALVEVYGLN